MPVTTKEEAAEYIVTFKYQKDYPKNLAEKAKATKKNKKTASEELERLQRHEDIDPSLILSNKRVAKPRYSTYKK